MKNLSVCILLVVVSTNSYGFSFSTKELSKEEKVLELGVCVKDEVDSGKKIKLELVQWNVVNPKTGAFSIEQPKFPGDSIRINTADAVYTPFHISKEYFEEVYNLKVKKHILTEIADRSWFFWTDDSTKRKVAENKETVQSFKGTKEASGDKTKQLVQKRTADFEAKELCEAERTKLLGTTSSKFRDISVDDTDRNVTKEAWGTDGKPVRIRSKASGQ